VDEERKRIWDVRLGIVGPAITVIALMIGIWQFNVGESNKVTLENELETHKDVVEFQRKLWLEKLDAYKNLVTLAGKFAAAADQQAPGAPSNQPTGTKPNIEDLWRELTAAYWGQKLFAEDEDVVKSLREFYDTARDFRGSWANADKVKVKADALAEACRVAIRRNAPEGAPK
jgi:hypothetical protein